MTRNITLFFINGPLIKLILLHIISFKVIVPRTYQRHLSEDLLCVYIYIYICLLLYEQPLLVAAGSGRDGGGVDMTAPAPGVFRNSTPPPQNTDLTSIDPT